MNDDEQARRKARRIAKRGLLPKDLCLEEVMVAYDHAMDTTGREPVAVKPRSGVYLKFFPLAVHEMLTWMLPHTYLCLPAGTKSSPHRHRNLIIFDFRFVEPMLSFLLPNSGRYWNIVQASKAECRCHMESDAGRNIGYSYVLWAWEREDSRDKFFTLMQQRVTAAAAAEFFQ